MDRRTALESHVRSMTAERVAVLLTTLTEGVVRYARATPPTLLHLLPILAYRPGAFERLTLAHHQVLYAAVGAVEDRERLREARADQGTPWERVPGPVEHETLLARLDADRPGLARVRAESTVADLVDLALMWPDGRNGYHLPDDAIEQFGLPHVPPTVREGLGRLDLAGVRRVALTLGLDPTRERATLTDGIEEVLGAPERVVELCHAARHDVAHLLLGHAFLGTEARTFLTRGAGEPFSVPADGTGDSDLDWMFEHGLLLPPEHPGDGLVMPREVALAVRGAHPWPFDPAPQAVVGVPVDRMTPGGGADVAEGSRAALTALAGADVRLLEAVAERPPRLRVDGLLMKQERRRLARVADGDEDLARVWLEAGAVLGLLTVRLGRVVPSEQSAAWRDLDTETRLAALAEAWAGTEDAALWWPAPEGGSPSRGRSGRARTRWALACALNDLPWGTSTGVVGQRLLAERAEGREPRTGARWLVSAVTWYQPSVEAEPDTVGRVLRALREAELLGAVFGGATTEVGRALSRRCRCRWEAWPHGSPETVAGVRCGLGPAPADDERPAGSRRSPEGGADGGPAAGRGLAEERTEDGRGETGRTRWSGGSEGRQPRRAGDPGPEPGIGSRVKEAGTEGGRSRRRDRGARDGGGSGVTRTGSGRAEAGCGLVGPGEARHRELREAARELFAPGWFGGGADGTEGA
ncbi:hypothetical protein [Nocardiopsis prasina]|uniref:hypothetical protein n=1 Tax=Nocardiopsis prasina TaxID=2015 RepID=UPI00034502C7|nr:hypothetical protein [Nocardiopsis prasina]